MPRLSPVAQQAVATISLACLYYATSQLYNYSSGLLMTDYRDKSALYGRELKPGESPSWP